MGLRLEIMVGREKRILDLPKKRSTVHYCFPASFVSARRGFDANSSQEHVLNLAIPHMRMAARQGFEPRLDVPKTSVLPLHHQA